MLLEFFQTGFSRALALDAFKAEGFRDHAHGQRAHFLGGLGHHRGCARTRAAAHARGDEDHIRITDGFPDGIDAFHGRLTANGRIGPGAEPLGKLFAQLHLARRRIFVQGLQIGVGADELHPLQTGFDHIFHGVSAAATHADDLDFGGTGQ